MTSENRSFELLGQAKDNMAESLDRIETHIKIRVDSITDEGTAALKANKRGAWITAAVVILVGILLFFIVPRATSNQILASLAILETKKAEISDEIQQLQFELTKLQNEKDEFIKIQTDKANMQVEKIAESWTIRKNLLEQQIKKTQEAYEEAYKNFLEFGIFFHVQDNGEFDILLPIKYMYEGCPGTKNGTIPLASGENFNYQRLWAIRVKPNPKNPMPKLN